MSKHPTNIEKYDGTLKELAYDLENLRYDKLSEFTGFLEQALKERAYKDNKAGKWHLGFYLNKAAIWCKSVQLEIDSMWNICKEYMDE